LREKSPSPWAVSAIVIVLLAAAVAMPLRAQSLPPSSLRYAGSPSGEYKLTIDASATGVKATLTRLVMPNETLWQSALPEALDPARFFVSETGTVTVLGDWGSADTDFAVMILRSDGSVLRQYTFSDIATTMHSSGSEFDAEAVFGIWAPDSAVVDNGIVFLPLNGISLRLDTDTGFLSPIQTGSIP